MRSVLLGLLLVLTLLACGSSKNYPELWHQGYFDAGEEDTNDALDGGEEE